MTDRARAELERELYWLNEQDRVDPGPLRDLRSRLEDLVDGLRADLSRPFPSRDPLLTAGPRWRRAIKRLLYRVLRPFTRRQDRVAADLAAISLELLDHLARAQDEIRRLEEKVLRLGGDVSSDPADEGA